MQKRLRLTLVVLGLVVAVAAPATAKNLNQAEAWCDNGTKIELDASSWTSDDHYDLVVVKSAAVNRKYYDVQLGKVLIGGITNGGQQADISHIILCPPPDDPGGDDEIGG
ncbi:MAG: hypothetical protein IIC71_05050 [Acidobacteria bacterium]|nr:hypothetical protein [Acidobacteriota bacterium]